jgi:hypothetical protein
LNDLNFESNEADAAKNLDSDDRTKVDETSDNAGKVEVVNSNCLEVEEEHEGEDEAAAAKGEDL